MNKSDLVKEVEAILQLPSYLRKPNNPSVKIVNAILKTVTKFLVEGHEVRIPGLGIFKPHTRPSMSCEVKYFYGGKNKKPTKAMVQLPPKKTVQFKPTKPLLRELNANL